MKFNTLLATDLYKVAQQNADDTQFEQDFSKLAYMFIQDRAQALMPYILGFETVHRNEDGSRAVGIFGFKIGKNYYYVPAFFLNNQVKGVDMILNKGTNTFVPLTEEWIDNILSKQTIELGTDASGDSSELNEDFENPNFDFLQRPTVGPLGGPKYGSKYASAEEPLSLSGAWDLMKKITRESIEKDAGFKEAWDGFVRACQHKPMKKSASSKLIRNYFENIGGPEAVGSMMQTIGSNIKFANAAMGLYDGVSAFYTDKFNKNCYRIKKAQESLPHYDVRVTETPSEKEDENRNLVEDGFRIIDKRPDSEKTEVYEEDFEKRINSPDKSGVYEVLMPDGSFEKAYVLYFNKISGGRAFDQSSDTVVYSPSKKKYATEQSNNIFVKDDSIGTIKDIYSETKPLMDIEQGSSVLFVGPNGTCVGPFKVDRFRHDSGDRPRLEGWWECSLKSNGEALWSVSDAELASFEGNPKISGGTVLIPSDWRFLELTEDNSSFGSRKTIFALGNSSTISESLHKVACHKLDIISDNGHTFYARIDNLNPTEEVNYKQASIKLVTKLGLTPSDARKLLKKAESNRKSSCTIKMAQFAGVAMGTPTEQTPAADPYTGIPVYETPYLDMTQGQFTNVPNVNRDNVPGENIGGEMERNQDGTPTIDQEAQDLASQASKAGQKTVFDQAAIGGLSKVYDTSAVIDSYLPEFTQSLDRLARILFLYYWKHDDFINRYGTDDTIEMEDLLRGVFKSLGRLTLDLKQKAIGKEDADAVAM